MFEISESDEKAVDMKETSLAGGKWAGVVKESIIGALNTKMISKDDQIVSIYHRCAACSAQAASSQSRLSHTAPQPASAAQQMLQMVCTSKGQEAKLKRASILRLSRSTLKPASRICSMSPSLGRDAVLTEALPWLCERVIK